MTIIKIYHRIGYFSSRNKNRVTTALSGAFTQNTTPRTLPIRIDIGTRKEIAVGEKHYIDKSFNYIYI